MQWFLKDRTLLNGMPFFLFIYNVMKDGSKKIVKRKRLQFHQVSTSVR